LLDDDADAERAGRIREIVKIVQESGVGEIEIEDEGMRVSVRRADEPAITAPKVATDAEAPTAGADARDGVMRVTSPMVGVFYRSANPGSPPFVEVGDSVSVGQTLCLLEAMKLFNELKAEVAGQIRAVHVDNAQPVEYETLLFEIEPVAAPPAV
jgi:acetyl-CoA carboxylase biotin carboxyl carrier protein